MEQAALRGGTNIAHCIEAAVESESAIAATLEKRKKEMGEYVRQTVCQA